MTITYNIGVHNELIELTELLEFLLPRIDENDEVLIQCDSDGVTPEVSQFVKIQERLDTRIKVIEFPLNKDFASFKNNMITHASGDYCFNIDPDEKPNEYLLYYVKHVLENNNVDVFFVPRVNTVEGLTDVHIQKWGWNVNDKGYVNFPDYQTRIFRRSSDVQWMNKVHERITGYDTFSYLPAEEEWSLSHHKTIQRQEIQNDFYETI